LPLQKKAMSFSEKARFKFLWFQLFDQLSYCLTTRFPDERNEKPVMVLRDYHADNLMILPNKNGHQQVGLLDFQDAVAGSRAYDLVSLLEDARRDVSEKTRRKIFDYYLEKSACDKEVFVNDYAILSLQRNIKIVGIFSRLSTRDGKHQYLDLLPRVLDFIKARLESSSKIFADISPLIKKFI
jgi:aminoglycoside/choline kinase family phosphotransferase